MKRKFLILPLMIALLIMCILPSTASDTGVVLSEGAGAPGKKVKMTVSIPEILASDVGLKVTYDTDALTMLSDSDWLIEGELSDVDAANGIAVWGSNTTTLQGEILELVFTVSENMQVGDTTEVTCEILANNGTEETFHKTGTGVVTIKDSLSVSGTVTSSSRVKGTVTVELLDENLTVVASDTVEVGETTYEISAPQGDYTLRVKKTKHCPRDYKVSLTGAEDIVQNVDIKLYGDVDGNDTINILDAYEIMKFFTGKESAIIDDYGKELAELTGEGSVNILDAYEIMKKFTGKPSVFDDFE